MLPGRPKRDVAVIRRIKEWAYEYLAVGPEVSVTVMELACHEPGCPPIETVVAVMEQGKDTRQWKFHKSVPDITVKDFAAISNTQPAVPVEKKP